MQRYAVYCHDHALMNTGGGVVRRAGEGRWGGRKGEERESEGRGVRGADEGWVGRTAMNAEVRTVLP
jgi:hypothetical protein